MRRLSCRAFGRLQESGIFFPFFLSKKKKDFINDFTLHKRYKSQDVFHMEKSGRINFFQRVRKVFLILWGVVHTVNTMISWLYQIVAYKRLKKKKSVARNITAC